MLDEYTYTFEVAEGIEGKLVQAILEVHFKINPNDTTKVYATLYLDDSQGIGWNRQRWGIDGRLYRRHGFDMCKALDDLNDSLRNWLYNYKQYLENCQIAAVEKLQNKLVGLPYITSEIKS